MNQSDLLVYDVIPKTPSPLVSPRLRSSRSLAQLEPADRIQRPGGDGGIATQRGALRFINSDPGNSRPGPSRNGPSVPEQAFRTKNLTIKSHVGFATPPRPQQLPIISATSRGWQIFRPSVCD
ncbi:hypothetical protein CORC01_11759 [Colletotrichum orchidophilum]|uniref:Uncharacterized protein n=1 Tax=Colletotrichum orchidophilum TaxID=1209926 RepID=A0A1G4AV42_9PEZI|nr:uncharacterized protein CORC01_11759 [Colletotrichum orchidophilum]OHE92966.1 hypothetical protein CORC01_11759 [Colletotrichum orchidophilum]